MVEVSSGVLNDILSELRTLKVGQDYLDAKITNLENEVFQTKSIKPSSEESSYVMISPEFRGIKQEHALPSPQELQLPESGVELSQVPAKSTDANPYIGRAILTTFPDQIGVKPIPLKWGAKSPEERGPILASRQQASLKVRNAIGAYCGSYSIYRALAVASGAINPNHHPDYSNTEPPFEIKHNPSWDDPEKIVALDPYGHLVPQVFSKYLKMDLDVRPTIAVTKAHIKLIDLNEAVRLGNLEVDNKIVIRTPTDWVHQTRQTSMGETRTSRIDTDEALLKHKEDHQFDGGVELNVSKAAVEPVWNLPGVANRFGIMEEKLRRALFEETGGMYPELITRPDLKVFLPPIGGLTAYIFGPPEYLSDETKELTLRVHDECNGSDVFGSDICTCRPYLIYGIEEAVRCAQRGGVGVVVYFRKEGRALGEVIKYLVYNARKRGGDNATQYFQRTEDIAGVKDMRFQALMPDVLHWLGIKKIDNMISMSDMKYDAIVGSGIPILKRYEIPEELIPPDSRVEIDAKIAAGYYSTTKIKDLSKTRGRLWEDLTH